MHKECAAKCTDCSSPMCDECILTSKTCTECTTEEPFIVESVRRSYLELYKKCPYAFYLNVVKGLGSSFTIYSQSGIDLHELFDEYSVRDDGSVEEMYERFIEEYEKNYPKEWYPTEEFRSKMHDRYMRNIEGFFNLRSKVPKPIIREEKIFFTISDKLPTCNITMDRIHEEDGMLVLGDYKTGKVMVGKKFTTDLQAPLYIYAVREHYKRQVKRFEFYYLGESKTRMFERVTDDIYECKVNNRVYKISISEKIREVRDILSKIESRQFNIDPRMKPYTCNICDFHDKQCAGSDVEIWRQARGESEWKS